MDITAVTRNVRFLFPPSAAIVIGILVMGASTRVSQNISPYLTLPDTLTLKLLFIGAAISFSALGWLCWKVYRLARWEAGERNGDCLDCGGGMRQLEGRYGLYRKCDFCRATRKGW